MMGSIFIKTECLINSTTSENQEIKKQTHKIIANCFLVSLSVDVINTISYTNLENERVYTETSAKKIKAGT